MTVLILYALSHPLILVNNPQTEDKFKSLIKLKIVQFWEEIEVTLSILALSCVSFRCHNDIVKFHVVFILNTSLEMYTRCSIHNYW